MNDAHFHLVVNHLPIIFPLVGAIILVTGLAFRSGAIGRAAFFIFILGSVTTVLAMYSGEGAEEVMERISEGSGRYIHAHEENAESFALLSYALGVLSLIALWLSWKQKPVSNIAGFVVLFFACVVMFFGRQTGTSGGEIRHTEIRPGKTQLHPVGSNE